MFLSTKELKKAMKDSLKGAGLSVGQNNGNYYVFTDYWGLQTSVESAPNKFKAALVELIGDISEDGVCKHYMMENKHAQEDEVTTLFPDPCGACRSEKDFAVAAPVVVFGFPHEYQLFQRKSDLKIFAFDRRFTTDMISEKELDLAIENMPSLPKIKDAGGACVLYFKNETTTYFIYSVEVGNKLKDGVLSHLEQINFFE